MLKYFRFSLFIALTLSVTYFVLSLQTVPQAHDGSGPDGNALIAFFVSILAIIALVHAGIVGLIFFEKDKINAKKGSLILVLGSVLVAFPYLKSQAVNAYNDYQYSSSPNAKMIEVIKNKGSIKLFLDQFDSIPEKTKDYAFYGDVIFQLCTYNRIDILEDLKAKGIAAANEENETTWADCIYGSVINENLKPSERLALAQWVFKKPIVNKAFLNYVSPNIFNVSTFFETFKDLQNPDVVRFFDLLVQHGVDLNKGDSIKLLWYAVRFKHFEHVNFLAAHKADINAVDPSSHTTALDEALTNNDQPTINFLLSVGAKKAADLKN